MRVQLSARYASDGDLIADLVRVASLDGRSTLTRARYDDEGQFHSSTVVRRIGSWKLACDRAGLVTGREDLGHTDDAWMENVVEVWTRLGRQPTYGDMRSGRFSPEGYAKRFGSWGETLLAFQAWLDADKGSLPDDVPPASSGGAVAEAKRSRAPGLRLRWSVLQRDRFTCVSCGASPSHTPGTTLQVDHIIPFGRGGSTSIENLQTLCDHCNYGKADS